MKARYAMATVETKGMATPGSAITIRANDALANRFTPIDRELFVDEPVRDPLIMLMTMLALKPVLIPSKREGELMDLIDTVEEALHGG